MPIESDAVMQIARFFASQPTPEQILAYHASPEVADCAYALISTTAAVMVE